jgi:hypothetical protein
VLTATLTGLLTGATPEALKEDRAILCIHTGLKHGWHGLHAIRTRFEVVPLETHANTSRSSKQVFKIHPSTHKRTNKQHLVVARV